MGKNLKLRDPGEGVGGEKGARNKEAEVSADQ